MIAIGQPPAGSLALGASLAGVGLVFAGVAAVAAQVSRERTSSTYGLAGARARRARTCCAPRATSATARCRGCRRSAGARRCARSRASAGGRWRCSLVATAALARRRVRAARAPRRRRRARRTAARAARAPARGSRHPLGLALRLQRGALLGWSVGPVLQRRLVRLDRPRRRRACSATAPSIAGLPRLGGAGASSTSTSRRRCCSMALIGAGLRDPGRPCGCAARRRAAGSSRCSPRRSARRCAGRAPTSRSRWAARVLVLAANGPRRRRRLRGQQPTTPRSSRGCWRAALVQLPAVWVLAGATVALFGLAPRAGASAAGACSARACCSRSSARCSTCPTGCSTSRRSSTSRSSRRRSSPPGRSLVLSAVAAALIAAGLAAFRRRDLAP